MFEREHHLRIATILQALDSELLAANACLFGGGTAIVLSRGEYRESLDIDFLVSDLRGYGVLRRLLTGGNGLRAVTRKGAALEQVRGVRADQYGVRTAIAVGGVEIKLEIIHESRVELEPPVDDDRVCGVARLTGLDLAATKLLANSDRWADDGVFSRDLIDLAMLEPSRPLLRRAMAKAATAYGDAIERDLARAIDRLGQRRGRLGECMSALKIDTVPKALLWSRIRRLAPSRAKR